MKTARIGVPIPQAADEIIDTHSRVTGIPKSDVIRLALEAYFTRLGYDVDFSVKRGRTRKARE